MGNALFLGVLILTALAVVGLSGGLGLMNVWLHLTRRGRHAMDASRLHLDVTPPIQPVVAELLALGFRRLGEVQTPFPFQPKPVPSWVFLDVNNTTWAEVVEFGQGAMLLLSSGFRNEAMLETGYPVGEHIDLPNFSSHTVKTSVQDTYQYHLKGLAEFSVTHGAPRRVASLNEALQ